jgi:hypothetical protein
MTHRVRPKTDLTEFIGRHIDAQRRAGKTLADIASEAGFPNPNVISMFKNGTAKIPLARVPMLATAIGAHPASLFRLAMLQYWPDMQHVVVNLFGDVTTPHERELLGLYRFITRNADPKLSQRQKREIERILREGP